jgi:hypothetical protein
LRTASTVFSSDSGFSMKSNAPSLDGRVEAAIAQALERDEPVDARQPDVEQDEVVRAAAHLLQARLAALDDVDVVALVAQHAGQRRAHARLVVDNQDG